MNILIIGHIHSGKSTISEYLKTKGFKVFSLGDGVKQFISSMFKTLHKLDSNIEEINLNDLYDVGTKMKYRQHMQLISTELMRNFFGDDIWINYLINQLPKDKTHIIIDDIRFKNELEIFKQILNPIVIKVESLKQQVSSHEEIDELDYDYLIKNDGTIDELHDKIDEILK